MSMIKTRTWLFISALVALLTGCSAAGVLTTSNPEKKLSQAHTLLELGRPIPAQRLIQESIDIYTQQNDLSGQAEAYAAYAEFHRSRAYRRDKAFFEKYGEYDPTLETTIRYFGKARDSYLVDENYAGASNIAFRLGLLYASINEREKACSAYDDSLAYNHEFRQRQPDAQVVLLEGFSSMEELICAYKAEAGCCEELLPIRGRSGTGENHK